MAEFEVSQETKDNFPALQKAYCAGQPILNEWTNHSAFYAVYPSYYYPFANFWIRRWLQWFDGFVPGIHDQNGGILSTRLATALCYRLAEQVYGGGLLFSKSFETEDSEKALKFISELFKGEGEIDEQILKSFVMSSAGGTSYLKTNCTSDKQLWTETFRADQCWCDVDFKGKVNRAKFIINRYTKVVPNDKEKNSNFYLIEERFYATPELDKRYRKDFADKINKILIAPKLDCGKPYVCYKVYRMQGVVNDFNQAVDLGRSLNWEELPSDIKDSIRNNYGAVQLNIPHKLPFLDLGVDMFKWTSFISNLPQLPYGESIVAKIQTYLFEYDYMNSCMNTDFYLGRGRVLVPKSLQNPAHAQMGGLGNTGNFNQGLDNFLFTKVEYASTEDKKPEAIQFLLRSNEWVASRNHLLENIATAIGISPSTIASYLNDSSARTAREISSEESATALFVENRRKLFTKPINDLIKRILLYYGYKDCIVAKFSQSGQTNTTLVTENTISQYNAKLRSQYLSVKRLNPDMSEQEIKDEIARIEEDQEKLRQQNDIFNGAGFNEDIGTFGEDANGTENIDSEEARS